MAVAVAVAVDVIDPSSPYPDAPAHAASLLPQKDLLLVPRALHITHTGRLNIPRTELVSPQIVVLKDPLAPLINPDCQMPVVADPGAAASVPHLP